MTTFTCKEMELLMELLHGPMGKSPECVGSTLGNMIDDSDLSDEEQLEFRNKVGLYPCEHC